ncbi:DUF998 domain-containing protein [Halorubrum sp. DTA46]|uniref:DUF998 domain-containing protein n=1 Tax=Halorubrum sp. DTA46 TaxID=3402162 RepID=UPI003AAFBB73
MREAVARAGDEGVSRAARLRVVTAALGAVATLLALGGIASATVLDPTFSWTSDALSDLGVRPRSAPAFNWGLIVGGAVGVGYAVGLWVVGRSRDMGGGCGSLRERLVGSLRAAVLGLAMVSMAGIGAFDLTQPLHGPAAVGFYALVTLLFAVDGFARRSTRTGRITLAFVPIHLAVWTTFLSGWWPVTGLALPELPGALMLAAWVWLVGPLPALDTLATDEH